MSNRKSLKGFVALLALAGMLGTAETVRAALIGSIWENDFSGDASVVPGGTPDGTFTSSAINYDSRVSGYTIGAFLNSPTWLTGAGIAGDPVNNVHIQLMGYIFLNAGVNGFIVEHDDGLTINVGGGIGNVLFAPGPTAPVSTSFTINAPSTGSYSFVLDYNECCGPPAVLNWEHEGGSVVGAPDGGSTLALLGGAMTMIGLVSRRFCK